MVKSDADYIVDTLHSDNWHPVSQLAMLEEVAIAAASMLGVRVSVRISLRDQDEPMTHSTASFEITKDAQAKILRAAIEQLESGLDNYFDSDGAISRVQARSQIQAYTRVLQKLDDDATS